MDDLQGAEIRIKGIREGLLLAFDHEASSFPELLGRLERELQAKRAFLQGSRVVLDLGARIVEQAQLARLQTVLADNDLELWAVLAQAGQTKEAARALGLATRLAGSHTDLDGQALAGADRAADGGRAPESGPGSNALLLLETIRSGRSVYHEGHVTIVGDVNPGAEVIAAGHVVVWGRLRGLVHAGAQGDETAVICALQLTPTQLRIADHIAIAPDESQAASSPEMARVRQGQIVAEPWRY